MTKGGGSLGAASLLAAAAAAVASDERVDSSHARGGSDVVASYWPLENDIGHVRNGMN